jgi:hypothetical protein
MYGIPSDLPLQGFVGLDCSSIHLGTFQIQFHFSDAWEAHTGEISPAGGAWEVRDASGTVIDRSQDHAEREAYHVHKLIGVPVTHFTIDAPKSFTLFFKSGFSLTIYDDLEHYESFSLHINDGPGYYI